MNRFLVPSKIGLLALIELYTEGIVPTEATIPLLSFILEQLLPASLKSCLPSLKSDKNAVPFIPDLEAFEAMLATYSTPTALPHVRPTILLWDLLLQKLWNIDSVHALHEFFASRSHLLAKTNEELKKSEALDGGYDASDIMFPLSRTSPLGGFVRRAKIEFDRLRFDDAIALWTAFVRWRQGSSRYWSQRVGVQKGRFADNVLYEGELDWGPETAETLELIAYDGSGMEDPEGGNVCTKDIQKLLEFQVEQMQSEHSVTACIVLFGC